MWQRGALNFSCRASIFLFLSQKRGETLEFVHAEEVPRFLAALCYKPLCFERKEIVIRQCIFTRGFFRTRG
jgi:hypothetical protein